MKKIDKTLKNWIKTTLISIIATLMVVILINYINDPLWVFNHANFSNKTQLGFNERQQKTNRLYFDNQNYDSILLGNSKSTYIDQNKFTKGKLFNYGVSAMNISEYDMYINFFKTVTNNNPKYILLAIDFNSCLKTKEMHSYQNPEFYINNTTSQLYKLKHLLSYSTFIYSLRNLTHFLDKKKAIYNNNNKKIKLGLNHYKKIPTIKDMVKIRKNPPINYQNAIYNEELPNIFEKIKRNNQKSNFKIILIPDFMPTFTVNKNKVIYNQCLNDIKEIFGHKNIFNFMKLNKDTINPNNYYDSSHFKDYVGDNILEKINNTNY